MPAISVAVVGVTVVAVAGWMTMRVFAADDGSTVADAIVTVRAPLLPRRGVVAVRGGYEVAWTGLGGLFERDDLTIINHECPSTDIVDPFPKKFVFRCDPAALVGAKRFGVDVANLANNHGFDQGPEALMDSMR